MRHIKRTEEMDMHKKFWSKKLKGTDHVENLDVGGETILK
jgi:hypothetical protein